MAINLPDFSKAPLLGSPISGLFESILKGYQMQQEPAKMKQEASARELANRFKQLEVEHKPKEYELDDKHKELVNAMKEKANAHYEEKFQMARDLNQARIAKLNNKTSTSVIKPNGKTANIAWVKQELARPDVDPNSKYAHDLQQSLVDAAEHEESITASNKDKIAGNAFDKQPMSYKKDSMSLMAGMGVDNVEAMRYLRKEGNSPEKYAKDHNIDINNVTRKHPPNDQNIKIAQQAGAYLDELDSMNKHITAGLGPYQNKIFGMSLKQVAEAAKNEDPETQGMVLAARALVPELSALRGKVSGANVGIEFLKEMEQKSLGNLKIFEGLVSPEAFEATQKYIDAWIREAGQARINALEGNNMLKSRLQKGAEAESNQGKVLNLATGKWENE